MIYIFANNKKGINVMQDVLKYVNEDDVILQCNIKRFTHELLLGVNAKRWIFVNNNSYKLNIRSPYTLHDLHTFDRVVLDARLNNRGKFIEPLKKHNLIEKTVMYDPDRCCSRKSLSCGAKAIQYAMTQYPSEEIILVGFTFVGGHHSAQDEKTFAEKHNLRRIYDVHGVNAFITWKDALHLNH